MALLLVVGMAVGAALVVQVARLGTHVVAVARAETAADAAALAAADTLALGRGAEAAVEAAVATARANGARLARRDCDCTGRFVTVRVTLRLGPVEAGARARAEIRPVLGLFAR